MTESCIEPHWEMVGSSPYVQAGWLFRKSFVRLVDRAPRNSSSERFECSKGRSCYSSCGGDGGRRLYRVRGTGYRVRGKPPYASLWRRCGSRFAEASKGYRVPGTN